ncbi:MAG: YbaB/EbfC family nucleoid-associated protein [Ruminococcaceae bacterium]|nr:YbaB/EbfC family nucleoid-associated protein [Oscillospiraceae bacterium]
MKARLPKGYGESPAKQLQRLQEEMQKNQEMLEAKTYEATAGGGAITVTMTGKKELTSVKLKPEVVDPEDIEMLEDLIIAAVNDVVAQVEEDANETMGALTGGLNIPGLG